MFLWQSKTFSFCEVVLIYYIFETRTKKNSSNKKIQKIEQMSFVKTISCFCFDTKIMIK